MHKRMEKMARIEGVLYHQTPELAEDIKQYRTTHDANLRVTIEPVLVVG